MEPTLPVRVAAVNDYEIIVAGTAQMLSAHPDKVVVCDRLIVGDPITTPVDVALYDTYGRVGIAAPTLRTLRDDPNVANVALFTLDLSPDLIVDGRSAGASGFISKALSGAEVADAIVRIASGEHVVAGAASPRPTSQELDWPGKEGGLTERESQVMVLAAEGLSNREIAAALYLGTETIKSYLRSVYLKLDLRNRVEAAAYVHRSGAFDRHVPLDGSPPGRRGQRAGEVVGSG
jgi:DNA-binding NarL/FixJ family response regulator